MSAEPPLMPPRTLSDLTSLATSYDAEILDAYDVYLSYDTEKFADT
jgi:hypothetical protein